MLDNSALLEASRHPTRIKPIGHGKTRVGQRGSAPVERGGERLGWISEKSGKMAARLIVGVKDGGVFFGDGGEEGGDVNREVLVRRQGERSELEH
jgi:hypothetical protein